MDDTAEQLMPPPVVLREVLLPALHHV